MTIFIALIIKPKLAPIKTSIKIAAAIQIANCTKRLTSLPPIYTINGRIAI